MDVNATIAVTVGNMTIRTGSDGRHYAVFLAEMSMDEKCAEEVFGPEFRVMAFGSRHQTVDPSPNGDATVERLGYNSFEPPRWLKFSVHRCDFWGVKGDAQPVMKKVLSGETGTHVIVELRFEVEVGRNAKVIGALASRVDSTAKVKLAPKCPSLGFKDGKVSVSSEATSVVSLDAAKKKKVGKEPKKKAGKKTPKTRKSAASRGSEKLPPAG